MSALGGFPADNPADRFVSVEEYLHTSYEHDPELIDGQLVERPMPTKLHGWVQAMISLWFGMHIDDWGVGPESEVRTRVRPSNFRLPDVSIVSLDPITTRTMDEPPLIAIEILSDDDRPSDLRGRARDLRAMGVEHIWLLAPEQRTAQAWTEEGWKTTAELKVPNSPVYLDLPWLWAMVDRRTGPGR